MSVKSLSLAQDINHGESTLFNERTTKIIENIGIAAIAIVAFAALATLAVSFFVLSGFMFSILLPFEGAVFLVIGIALLVFAGAAANSAIQRSIEAHKLIHAE